MNGYRTIATSYRLAEALKAEGFPLPVECASVRLLMSGPGEPMMLQYDVYLSTDDLAKLGRALQWVAEYEGES